MWMDSLSMVREWQETDILNRTGIHPYFEDDNIHQKDFGEDNIYDLRHLCLQEGTLFSFWWAEF